jgi:hypothetical protein
MTEKTQYRPWDLGRAAFFGILVGSIFSVMESVGMGSFRGATRVGIVLSMADRLSAMALLFAAFALLRNIVVRARIQRQQS